MERFKLREIQVEREIIIFLRTSYSKVIPQKPLLAKFEEKCLNSGHSNVIFFQEFIFVRIHCSNSKKKPFYCSPSISASNSSYLTFQKPLSTLSIIPISSMFSNYFINFTSSLTTSKMPSRFFFHL
jgi:hypothetical protein